MFAPATKGATVFNLQARPMNRLLNERTYCTYRFYWAFTGFFRSRRGAFPLYLRNRFHEAFYNTFSDVTNAF
jgi:hypothetical protein